MASDVIGQRNNQFSLKETIGRRGLKVIALVDAKRGQCVSSELCIRGREEQLLFEYLGEPGGAVSMRIESVKKVRDDFSVYLNRSGRDLNLRIPVDLAGVRFANDVVFGDGSSVIETVQRWGYAAGNVHPDAIPLISVVEPIALAIAQGVWGTIIVTCRDIPERKQSTLLIGKDSDAMSDLLKASRHEQPVDVTRLSFNGRIAEDVCGHLRRWSATIIQAAQEQSPGTAEYEVMCLKDAIAHVESVHKLPLKETRMGFNNVLHAAGKLISCLRQASLLLLRTGLATSVDHSISIILGGTPLEGLVRDIKNKKHTIPSPTTVGRSQLTMDAALILLERDTMMADNFCFFITCDSSLQCSADLFVCKTLRIAGRDLLAAFKFAQELQAIVIIIIIIIIVLTTSLASPPRVTSCAIMIYILARKTAAEG